MHFYIGRSIFLLSLKTSRYGALLLVDTVVSICAEPFFMDEWGVDAVYTSSQKALSGPAGISPVAFGERAQ